jgi:DNA-binding MarR family transcriptional regulator
MIIVMKELVELFDEVRLLEHRLVQVVEALHGNSVSVAGRGVLEYLRTRGPTTVPDLARARLVSRQHIQTVMDTLADSGLVVATVNPAHRRSPVFDLTVDGRSLIVDMHRRETAAMRRRARRSGVGHGRHRPTTCAGRSERVTGIEPAFSAWEADVLPLNDTRGRFVRLAA